MGGCLDKPKPKGKKQKVSPELTKPAQSARMPANRHSLPQEMVEIPEQSGPKYRKITIAELLAIYQVESTLELSSKLEGPKYLSGLTDGSSRVLRVVVPQQISQKRLQIYKKIIGFDSFQSEEGSIFILDEYCSGLDLYELLLEGKKEILVSAFKQIIATISSFHENRTWLGNLHLSSFRQRSLFGNQMRLVDFNLVGHVPENEKMGFAHKDSYEADYQFLGYLLQFIQADQPPIFIQHKLQYVHCEGLPMSNTIQKLLKGVAPTKEEVTVLTVQQIVNSSRVLWGYRFRRDINKLLKMRRKRKGHNRVLYGSDVQASMGEGRFNEELAYRMQSQRIFSRIEEYIVEIRSIHEQSFLNYGGGGQQLRRLKEVFLLTDKDKKMGELKQCLSTIK